MLAEARNSPRCLRFCIVDKNVDFFPESGEDFQESALAKGCSFLVYEANPYFSIIMKRAFSSPAVRPRQGCGLLSTEVIHIPA
jgi:hypothetical protein